MPPPEWIPSGDGGAGLVIKFVFSLIVAVSIKFCANELSGGIPYRDAYPGGIGMFY